MGVRRPLPLRDLEHVLEHTHGLWDELRGERLFITGGTGFVGGWMLESLLHADDRLGLGVEAIVLARDPDGYRAAVPHVAGHGAVRLLRGDVHDFTLPSGPYSNILHMATETRLASHPAASFQTAVTGTSRVLELASASGARRLLLTSSGAVYGRQPPDVERLEEDFTGAPQPEDVAASYGHGKRAAEFLCAAAAAETGLEVKIARCFAFVGPLLPLDANFAVGNFIRDALAGGPIRVMGDGTPRRSYLYAADLAIWLWTVLLRGTPGRPYNVGSDEDVGIAELARFAAAAVQTTAGVIVAKEPTGGGTPPARYVPSVERARSELHLEAWVPLEEGIRRTAEWYSTGPMRERDGPPLSVS